MTGSNFTQLYKQLNVQQKKAVNTIDGPVLVLAGPGTGKTQVLTMRIANILKKTDTPPDAILALTFTESGVRSMKERLMSIVGKTAYYTNIHTFHSFASEIIRSNSDEFVISTQLEPLSDLERIYIFKEIFDELDLRIVKPFNSPYFYLKTAVSRIQDLKREGVDPIEYKEFIEQAAFDKKDKTKNLELLQIYQAYIEKLKKYGRYDFEDMINFVIEKFKTSPSLLSKYQERYHYFLVDEFQDTNSAQAELLYQLSSFWKDKPNLFVVGDDDQSIFRFQGASIENISTFLEKFPNASKIALNTNYRNIQPIIDVSQEVIAKNKYRISSKYKIDKRQKSKSKTSVKTPISIANFNSSHTENYFIASEIKTLIQKGIEPSEIAVIYRNNADATDIADMLARLGVTYQLEGGENVLESGIIVRLLHLLQVILKVRTKAEDLDLFTLLNYDYLGFDPLDVLKLSRFASLKKINFFEAIAHKDLTTISLKDEQKLKEFEQNLVLWNELSANTTFIEFVDHIINDSGYLSWILNQQASYEYLNILNSFLSEIKRLNTSDKNLNLKGFLHYIDLMKEHNIRISEETLDIETNNVRLATAHKAKGQEFEYVYIPKFVDKKWSNISARDLLKLPNTILKTVEITNEKDKKAHQEEDDRRLFYVVLTRAKSNITITSSRNYQTVYGAKTSISSMFLHDIPKDQTKLIDVKSFEKNTGKVLQQLLQPKLRDHKITENEKAFLKFTLRNFKISATALNTYLDCPYKFKLNYLFRTPMARARPLVMGIAVHKTLEVVYKKLLAGESVNEQLFLDSFENALKSEVLNDQEFNDILREGNSILKVYYATYELELTTAPFNQLLLEKFLGWGWSKPLLDGEIPLQGKVDKIEILNEDNKVVKVTDYKTGRPKSRNDILGKTKYSSGDQFRQLLFYKLLIDLDDSFNYKVNQVELDFVGKRNHSPRRELFDVENEDIDTFKKTVREVYNNIKAYKFERTNDYTSCTNCQYRFHCWPDGIPTGQMKLGIK